MTPYCNRWVGLGNTFAPTSMQRDYAWHSSVHIEDLEPAVDIGREAGERAVARLNAARPKAGKYPVLFDARVSSSLLGHLSGAISGSAIARKTSFLQDKLGGRIFAKGVTITDDPLRPRGLRSRPFDGEGVRVKRMEIVRDGILTTWLAESESARQLGIQPTGHAARGAAGSPGVSPSNFTMAAGSRTPEQMFADFSEALLVVELIGQGANPVTGDYSRGAVGFMASSSRQWIRTAAPRRASNAAT